MLHLDHVINVKNKVLILQVGNRIRELRIERGLSQLDLADEAEVPLSQIGRIERGENNPTISTLYALCTALKIDLNTLLDFKVGK